MNKILVAFDGTHFSEGALNFIRNRNEISKILVTGVFLPKLDFADLRRSYSDGMIGPLFIPVEEKPDSSEIEKNILRFEAFCIKNQIEFRVHRDFENFAMPELKKETRFAHLLVIGSESFYKNLGTEEPNEYLQDALHSSECPVVVVPEKYEFPQSNILTYDGSEASVYAIKQFTYLFPDMTSNNTLLVYARDHSDKEMPDEIYIEELVSRSFPNLTIMKLNLEPAKYFARWLSDKKSAMVISGSYGRSSFSSLFKKSFITGVIKDHKIPAFISHP